MKRKINKRKNNSVPTFNKKFKEHLSDYLRQMSSPDIEQVSLDLAMISRFSLRWFLASYEYR